MPDSLTSRESTTTSVVLLATTPAGRLSCADGTLLDRITGQLATLPVSEIHVVTPGGGLGADLRGVAKIARISTGALAVLPADLVAHTEALALLLEHPAHATGALVFPDAIAGPMRPPVRVEGGKVVAAGSSFHVVPEANATFRGGLQAGESDLGTLADIAEELAELADAGRLGPVTAVEAVDLLLVGLVRSGAQVRAAAIGPLHADRVTGQQAADTAIAALADVDEARVRLDTSVKQDDGFFATFFVSTWSRYLIKPAVKLKLTPNTVTGVSVALALLAAVWFSAGTQGGRLLGALLFYLSFVLDCLDGQLARYTRTFSPLGAWADGMADRFKEYTVYIGLAVGSTDPGIWRLAVAATILQVVRHSIDFAYAGAVADAARVGAGWGRPPRSLLESAHGRRPTGFLGLTQIVGRRVAGHWAKKIIMLSVGERTALIAVTAAFWNARVTFLSLLCWGGVAVLYQLAGRMLRSAR
ncbi:CDP-alcohol phosphatidyltransferase family protein [Nonomuraea turkmeniaca]|uniref:CDP-alcohol phosphatidyltransferase family protein n=1 Tax=Nonomuraea turkmeniaca TaxID=103838 RepID=A0A5S4FCG6_9ACTN|nr:CDP-alcohol phosphatidyltransferase family protein [Nonomuraea turkmeniaca]TMR15859.1 CDP-alcohol phosphatidyltransferase family protein [Nonomuraea turkmeniaca]